MKEERIPLKDVFRINLRALKFIYSFVPWNWFWNFMQAISSVLFGYWSYYFICRLINHISAGASREILLYDVLFIVGGQAVLHIIYRSINYFYFYSASNVWEYANAKLNQKIMDMDYEYMESESIHNRKREIDEMARFSGGGINTLFWNTSPIIEKTLYLLVVLGYTVYLMHQGRTVFGGRTVQYIVFFAVFVALLSILMALTIRVGKRANKKYFTLNEGIKETSREFFYYIKEYISKEECGKNIRMFHQQNLLSNHIAGLFQHIYRIVDDIEETDEWEKKMTSILEVLISGVIYFMLGWLALKRAITIGDVCLYAGAISLFLQHFRWWIDNITNIYHNTKYVKMYMDFMDIPNRKYEGTLPVEKRSDDKFTIEFRNVSFRYPGTDRDVLKNFSIRFQIGERLAVVGKNGSGKTTFIKLLCRLYDPTEGEILLNRIDIRKYDYREYLSLFSVVFQDFSIPAFPLGENVATSMEYEEDRVKSALERVGLSDLLEQMPQKLDTALYKHFDKGGVDISGGEAQKLAIARALYHDTPFVILDEPTAALDPLAEYEVYSHFDELIGTKTAVYISHRLSSCQFCNDILVIDDGQAVQRGSHEELIRQKEGLYYQLWNVQAQYYREGDLARI